MRRRVSMLPNLLTLANAGCGLLAISKAIDALSAGVAEARFDRLLEAGCWLVLLAGVLDALDGRIARLTDSFSDFGAQLDSFADAITFGVAPAMVAKVYLERHDVLHPRVHFLAAAAFTLMAVLRLARFNVETGEDDDHRGFRGLPSPAAAGMVISLVLLHLSLSGTIEVEGGRVTPVGRGVEFLPEGLRAAVLAVLPVVVLLSLPLLGLLMVSRVAYPHAVAILLGGGSDRFPTLVRVVFLGFALYLAPVPVLFMTGVVYIGGGLLRHWNVQRKRTGGGADRQRAA